MEAVVVASAIILAVAIAVLPELLALFVAPSGGIELVVPVVLLGVVAARESAVTACAMVLAVRFRCGGASIHALMSASVSFEAVCGAVAVAVRVFLSATDCPGLVAAIICRLVIAIAARALAISVISIAAEAAVAVRAIAVDAVLTVSPQLGAIQLELRAVAAAAVAVALVIYLSSIFAVSFSVVSITTPLDGTVAVWAFAVIAIAVPSLVAVFVVASVAVSAAASVAGVAAVSELCVQDVLAVAVTASAGVRALEPSRALSALARAF